MAIDRSSILNRIRKIFEGLPQTKIAIICGVTHQAVNRYYRKSILPNYDAMLRIAKYANVSMEWLLTGKGPKELSATAVREAGVLYKAPHINVITSAEYKKRLQNQISDKDCIYIPIISESVAIRIPLIIKDKDIEKFACVCKAWVNPMHTYCCLQVRCNCMHPVISEGFIVAIDLHEYLPHKLENHIVAARYNGYVTIRYFKMIEKEYVLLPNNIHKFKPIVIPRTESNPFIGKVAWWWGKQK